MAYNYLSKDGFTYFWSKLKVLLNRKYDKTGGEITGTVKVDGNLILDIDDPDYDSGITFRKSLDTNKGTILTLSGYANSNGENTSYRPIITNIATPQSDYDVANKKYVDDNQNVPRLHLVELGSDGSVVSVSSTLVYSEIKGNLTNPKKSDYLDIIMSNGDNTYTRFQAYAVGITEVNNGNLLFSGHVTYKGTPLWLMFSLDRASDLTLISIIPVETQYLKTGDIVGNATSTSHYPTTKGVFDTFQRKPVVVWQDSTGLKALQTNIDTNINWQLTGLDLTPYRRIKVYARGGKGSTTAGVTGQIMIEILLDSSMGISAVGGHFVGSTLAQKPNDSNRYASLTVAVSADKTKFAVLRQTSLYGTAATTNNDIGADVILIEGYYD